MTRGVRLLTLVAVALAAAGSALAGGGPAPGVSWGSGGVLSPDRALRYVALDGAGGETTVAAIRVRDGRVVRWRRVAGVLGVPIVAFDGTTDGVSADGRTLVLATPPPYGATAPRTLFAVLRLPSLAVAKTIDLRGFWAFDAISPDGRTIVAAQFGSADPEVAPRYRIRSIDVARGAPRRGVIVAKGEAAGRMLGQPIARAFSRGRSWAFTLYVRPTGTAFVHALDTVHRSAVCVDLPWRSASEAAWTVRMAISADGRELVLLQGGRRLAEVDLGSFTVRSLAEPRIAVAGG